MKQRSVGHMVAWGAGREPVAKPAPCQSKGNQMRNKILAGLIAGSAILGAPAVAFAAGQSDGSQASSCGTAHAAQADIYGNYGYLGQEGGAPGAHNGAVGQQPDATGYNNSHTNCQSQ